MNSQTFLEEVQTYIKNTYSEFQEYQEIVTEILFEFNRVCNETGIDYYLAYGSLLGAVRDEGQIPWDYDVDVFVKINDKERLLQELDNKLGDGYYYDYVNKHKTYPTTCLRVCKKGYSMLALHVDVFFLIGLPEDEKKQNVFFKDVRRLVKIRENKYLNLYFKPNYESAVEKILGGLMRFRYAIIPGWWIRNKEKELQYANDILKADNYMVYLYGFKVLPKRIFDGVKKINFKGQELSLPIGYEEFLKIIYGDYKSYLPIKKRFDEFYKMKNQLDKRQQQYLTTKD